MTDRDGGGFLDREQLLGGAPARRAATLLYLIEGRTARLAALGRRRVERPLSDASAQERALAFVEAFSQAEADAAAPSVYDLERHAERWAPLVPHNPRLQAALARAVGEKYRFSPQLAPGIAAALSLGDDEVRQAFRSLYGEPVESAFARPAARERAAWAWTSFAKRLESLPPFWTAYALTLIETVGVDILALPIALAGLSPAAAVVILVVLGLVNLLTTVMTAEALVRSGPMRYGNAYAGTLFRGFLGSRGSLFVSALLVLFSFIWLPVCYVGLGRTLAGVTSVPAGAWVAALFVATVLCLRRGTVDATVATVLTIGAVDLVLLAVLTGAAFAHVHESNLLHQGALTAHGRPFAVSAVGLVFGVVLTAYFGQLAATTCGSVVLDRDPTGRSLIRGCAGAQLTAIAIYVLFVVGVTGAVGHDALESATGTVVEPLARVAGAGVSLAGSVFAVLALGLGSVMEGLSLAWLVQERIPQATPRVLVLPRRRARLVFRARRAKLRVGLEYLGAGVDGAHFSVDVERPGTEEQSEVVIAGHRDLVPPGDPSRHRLSVEVLSADDRRARVAVTTTLPLAYEGELDDGGLELTDALELSDAEARLVAALARAGSASAAELAASTGSDDPHGALERLVARGFAEARDEAAGRRYSLRLAPRRARTGAVWDALRDDVRPCPPQARRIHTGVASSRSGRLFVSALPLALAFAFSEYLVLSGAGSFAGLLSFLGIIVVSLLAGLCPILLLVAARRKGEYAPEPAWAVLGSPLLLVPVYVLFLGVLVLHAALIWTAPAERATAAAAALAMLLVPVLLARARAFRRSVTFELCDDARAGTARFAVLAGDRQPGGPSGAIADLTSLRRAVFVVGSDAAADEVKVWAHRVSPEGESEALAATASVRSNGAVIEEANLALSRGEAVFGTVAGARVEVLLRGGRAS